MTTREYMRQVTAVDPFWLAELAPMFFAVKEEKNVTFEEKSENFFWNVSLESRRFQEDLQQRMMEEQHAEKVRQEEEKRQQKEIEWEKNQKA